MAPPNRPARSRLHRRRVRRSCRPQQPRARRNPTTTSDDQGNTFATATPITAGTYSGAIALAGDIDIFRLNVPANTTIAADLRFGTLPRGSLAIYNGSGQVVAEDNDVVALRAARVNYNARDVGAYYIRVGPSRTDATGTYSIVERRARR